MWLLLACATTTPSDTETGTDSGGTETGTAPTVFDLVSLGIVTQLGPDLVFDLEVAPVADGTTTVTVDFAGSGLTATTDVAVTSGTAAVFVALPAPCVQVPGSDDITVTVGTGSQGAAVSLVGNVLDTGTAVMGGTYDVWCGGASDVVVAVAGVYELRGHGYLTLENGGVSTVPGSKLQYLATQTVTWTPETKDPLQALWVRETP